MKKVVRYRPEATLLIKEGWRAVVWPVDHPDSDNVSNGKYVYTSPVIWYDESTGEFETENTKYLPLYATN